MTPPARSTFLLGEGAPCALARVSQTTGYDTGGSATPAFSKADGSQSLDLQRDALRAEGVDAGNVYPCFLTPCGGVAPRGTRLSRNARSSHRPALVSLGHRSGSDQARCSRSYSVLGS